MEKKGRQGDKMGNFAPVQKFTQCSRHVIGFGYFRDLSLSLNRMQAEFTEFIIYYP